MPESNILIIDDSSTVRHGITLVLKRARLFDDYLEAASAAEGLQLLDEHSVEVIICDIVMPGMDGYEFLQIIKNRAEFRDIPVIMLTGQESVDKKVKGLDMGASDYLTKPFDTGELIARVRVQLKVKRLQDELKVANQRYLELSITDYLTQIHNRRHFMDLFEQEFSRALRYNYALSLMIFDLDNFKRINDTKGHLVGDQVLKQVTEIVKPEIRSHDVFARYGGEEFVVLLPQTPKTGARLAAEKIRQKVAQHEFGSFSANDVTISIGLASYPTASINDGQALLNAADDALYKAKANGKNRVEVAEFETAEGQ